MISVERLVVSIFLNEEAVEVGELALADRKIYFKYYPAFIDRGIEISPIQLKLSENILTADPKPFDGMFGVFNDSLPDEWGRLLLDRSLLKEGFSPNQATVLDRLAYVGNRGSGALTYHPKFEPEHIYNNNLELDEIATEVNGVIEGSSDEVIEKLFDLGGSSGGARPKIFVGYNQSKDHFIHGTENLPDGYEHWIIKFPGSTDPSDMANIEFAYHKMALAAGIEMSECKLFPGNSGQVYFGTKRFDRTKAGRTHMHSASGIMHNNFRLSNLDYGHIMDCAFTLERHVGAYEKVLQLAAFNVFAHNRDDHSKNIAFLMDHTGAWRLSPAYDLTFSSSSHGMHSTTVAGESKAPGTKHLLELATDFGVKNAHDLIENVRQVILDWPSFAKDASVSSKSLKTISSATKQVVGKG
jgi:serine/threonine-protein kinase HipA